MFIYSGGPAVFIPGVGGAISALGGDLDDVLRRFEVLEYGLEPFTLVEVMSGSCGLDPG